jgi:hypothetical protein
VRCKIRQISAGDVPRIEERPIYPVFISEVELEYQINKISEFVLIAGIGTLPAADHDFRLAKTRAQ